MKYVFPRNFSVGLRAKQPVLDILLRAGASFEVSNDEVMAIVITDETCCHALAASLTRLLADEVDLIVANEAFPGVLFSHRAKTVCVGRLAREIRAGHDVN